MTWLYIAFVLLAGAALPIQAGLNARLARAAGHPVWATTISFATGAVILALTYLALRAPWPSVADLRAVPLWAWAGGVLGAFYVTTVVIVAPRLGAATALAFVIVGQMVASLLLDHVGALEFPVQPISILRVVGVILLLAGASLIRNF